MTRTTRLLLALALFGAAAPAARAQTIWTPLDHRTTARVEFWHAHFKQTVGAPSSSSGPLFFSLAFPIDQKLAMNFELPYARATVDDPFSGTNGSESTIGNPYFGVQIGALNKPTSFVGEVGLRLAATSESKFGAILVGIVSEPERLEAFVPKTNIVSAAGNIVIRRATSSARIRLGVSELLASAQNGGNNTLIDYGAQASTDVQLFRFGGALTGRYAASGSGTFSERSNHFATGMASVALGGFRPGVSVRLPFDKDIRDGVPWMLGLSLEYEFK
ncbi:MAG: hypothetical protein HOQ12_05775 [Gemmatimonadaceae bacterium]|nr:hypothetical protein [Gemmatimonadaceae bacterium]